MDIKKMKKEELELLSNKDITYYLLENSKRPINTANLFNKIIKLLGLPESDFDKKVGDYYMALSTDKRFILLEDGRWDLRSNHTSDKVVKIIEEDEEETEEEKEEIPDEIEEDNYDDTDDNDTYAEEEDLKDLVIIDEEELELGE